jgi:hypothetical protein
LELKKEDGKDKPEFFEVAGGVSFSGDRSASFGVLC